MIVYVIVLAIFIGLYIFYIPFRLIVQHPILSAEYAFSDLYKYYRYKLSNVCQTGEIVGYVGLFGKGKTLSAVHKVISLYNQYNDKLVYSKELKKFVIQKVEILSNVQLIGVPYTSFVSLAQIFQSAEQNKIKDKENETYTVTLVLGDEFSVQLNSRSFKDNINPLFLNTLLTCRHHHISLYYTAQRFGHVDALLRQVTSYVIDCNKMWRFMVQSKYDAWDMENATNSTLLQPLIVSGWFIKDSDYNSYDTLATVQNLQKKFSENDMLTEQEILSLQNNQPANLDGLLNPSKKLLKRYKKAK